MRHPYTPMPTRAILMQQFLNKNQAFSFLKLSIVFKQSHPLLDSHPALNIKGYYSTAASLE